MQFPLQDSYQVLIMKTEGKNPHAPAVGAESSCFEYTRSILLFLAGPFSRDTVLPASVAGVLTETRHIHPKLPLVLLSYLRRDKKKKRKLRRTYKGLSPGTQVHWGHTVQDIGSLKDQGLMTGLLPMPHHSIDRTSI